MYKSFFGRNKQISFTCPEDYYELLGFLAKSDGSVSLTWENNEDQGAWGSEGRVCFHTRRLPSAGCLRFTAGNGSIYKRVNCNAFVEHYADIITLCKESIRIYLQSAKQYLLNTFQTLNKV